MRTTNKSIEIKNLTIGYVKNKQHYPIVSKLNISIEKGKLVTILGKNGAGKSTLLKTLSKVQKPLFGDIYINNKNINHISDKEFSKQVSIVLTERLPESQLTVFEIVALGRQPHTNWIDILSDTDLNAINLALEQTEISHLKNRRFYELSDGQLQRVLIARALAQDTEIIILDEPTSHLDLHHTLKIFSLLKKLVSKTNKTLIFSSHHINLSIQISDYILLLTNNNCIFGKPEELIEQNAFDNLFPNELVSFNKSLKQFVVHKL